MKICHKGNLTINSVCIKRIRSYLISLPFRIGSNIFCRETALFETKQKPEDKFISVQNNFRISLQVNLKKISP